MSAASVCVTAFGRMAWRSRVSGLICRKWCSADALLIMRRMLIYVAHYVIMFK